MQTSRYFGVLALWIGGIASAGVSATQKTADPSPVKLNGEQLRLKVRDNVMRIFATLEQSERIVQAAELCFENGRWEKSLAAFQGYRVSELHDAGHGIIKSAMPDIMQKFMPKYMQARIMAERKAKKLKGPPSATELEKIRADALARMKPAMQNTAMTALRKLTDERMNESLKDENILTRAMAGQILKVIVLPEPVLQRFRSELDKAGYPESLIQGTDSVFNERVRTALQSIDIAAVAKEAGL